MKTHKFSYYEVSYDPNVDLGGSHRNVVIGKFTKSADAEKFAEGKGAYGSNADVKYVTKSITIFESYEEAIGSVQDAKKQAALSKLTKEERKLLNLD